MHPDLSETTEAPRLSRRLPVKRRIDAPGVTRGSRQLIAVGVRLPDAFCLIPGGPYGFAVRAVTQTQETLMNQLAVDAGLSVWAPSMALESPRCCAAILSTGCSTAAVLGLQGQPRTSRSHWTRRPQPTAPTSAVLRHGYRTGWRSVRSLCSACSRHAAPRASRAARSVG